MLFLYVLSTQQPLSNTTFSRKLPVIPWQPPALTTRQRKCTDTTLSVKKRREGVVVLLHNHSRCLALPEQLWGEADLQQHFLDLLGDRPQLEVEIMLKGEGGDIAHHIDGSGSQDLAMTTAVHLQVHHGQWSNIHNSFREVRENVTLVSLPPFHPKGSYSLFERKGR